MSDNDIRAQMRHWETAWYGDATAVDDVCAPEVLYHMPPFPDLRGVEAQQQFTAAFHLAFPDFQITIEEESASTKPPRGIAGPVRPPSAGHRRCSPSRPTASG